MSNRDSIYMDLSLPLGGGGGRGVKYLLQMKLEELKPGQHVCWIYKDEEEFNSLIVPLILSGLKNNEKVIYVNTLEELDKLKNLFKDVKFYIEKGQLSLLPPNEFYSSGKDFDLDNLSKGYSFLRAISVASWALKDILTDSILNYEAKINSASFKDKILAVCLYDKRKIDTSVLLSALQTHPLVIMGNRVYSNFYYVPPEELLKDRVEATFNSWVRHLEDRLTLEEHLKELQNFYQAIFENTGTATIIIEEDTTISLINKAYENIFGFKKEDVEWKMSWQDFVYNREDLERMREYHRLRRIDPNLAPKNYETRMIDKYGKVKDCWFTVDMIPGTKKSIVSILDITELKRINRLLKMLSEVNQVLVRVKDEKELVEKVLQIIKTTGGYKDVSIGSHKDDDKYLSFDIFSIYKEEELYDSELKILNEIARDIDYKLSSLMAEKRYETLFKSAPIALFEEDLSELKEYLGSLKSLGIEDLESYFDTHPEELKKCIRKIKIIDINKASLDLFKAKRKEDLIEWNKIIPEEALGNFKKEIVDISNGLASGEFRSINYNLLGEKMDIHLKWFIIPEYRETLSTAIIAIIDVTEREILEEELRNLVNDLKEAFEQTVRALSSVVEVRDLYTSDHQKRVARLACKIAEKLELNNNSIELLRIASLLHDIGKISIAGEILNKPGKLSPLEFEMIKTHPKLGYEILENISYLPELAQVVLQHHERLDGSGYPQGLKNGEILLEARILAVADVVEAMTSHRPYRPAYTLEEALEEMSKNKGRLYDPDVVDALIEVFKEGFKF